MKLRAVVIDDIELHRNELKRLLSLHPDVVLVGEAGDMASGRKLIEDVKPDVVFLDIRMEGDSDGLDLGRRLKRLEPPPCLVFVTGYPEHALAAFRCPADDYLVKPIDDAKLDEALKRARAHEVRARAPQPVPPIFLEYREKNRYGENKPVEAIRSPDKIIYIETRQDGAEGTVFVCLEGKELDGVHRKLGDLEGELAPHGFFRPNRSNLINLARVIELRRRLAGEGFDVVLDGTDKRIRVARERLEPLRVALKKRPR